jgi:hypothetical protein
MADEIASERVFRKDAQGVERLVAAPGDPIPPEDDALGYREAIDTRADTADARLAGGASHEAVREEMENRSFEDDVPYADPLPKPGEPDEGKKAKSSAEVEDKAKKKG